MEQAHSMEGSPFLLRSKSAQVSTDNNRWPPFFGLGRKTILISFTLNLILSLSILAVVINALAWQQRADCSNPADARYRNQWLNNGPKKLSSYSPIFDEVVLTLHDKHFNGRLQDNSSIFRQDPSPEVDEAWDSLSAEGFEVITVDKEAVVNSGKLPRLSVKAPTSWGLGDDAYIAQIDVFHQIHCLNELRKEIHFDYYYGDRTTVLPDHALHKKHCIHMLLQNLMCHADADIITHNWVHYDVADQPTRPYAEPLADFSVIKKCRDFDSLLAWTQKNAVKDLGQKWHALQMPTDAEFVQGDGYF
ncbi:hypothetical protein BJ170DRAFT_617379 [Xylariales sp. AK1849]|nr:hypothetical protein BJ170DRAFT_617379 [Xylariales sp. AK1849]